LDHADSGGGIVPGYSLQEFGSHCWPLIVARALIGK
jgi:hypothetical protein